MRTLALPRTAAGSPALAAAPLVALRLGGSDLTGLHLVFAAVVVLLVVVGLALMLRGWRLRGARHDDVGELPAPPADTGPPFGAPLKGMYLGTVDAGSRLDRITTQGLGDRADGWLQVTERGVRVDRAGASSVWIPREALRGARLDRAHAGKVAGPGRIVVVCWAHADRELETGFRGIERARQPKVVRSVHAILGPGLFDETEAPAAPAVVDDQDGLGALRRLRRTGPAPTPEPVDIPATVGSGDPGPGPGLGSGYGGEAYGVPTPARGLFQPAHDPTPIPAPTPTPPPAPVRAAEETYPNTGPMRRLPVPDGVDEDVDPLTSPLGQVVRALKDKP